MLNPNNTPETASPDLDNKIAREAAHAFVDSILDAVAALDLFFSSLSQQPEAGENND